MSRERVHRKIKRTPEDKARLRKVRADFQKTRPSLDDLVNSGDYSEPTTHQAYLETQAVAHLLKQAREDAQMSLQQASDASGIDRSAISRLENGMYPNTTVNTLTRLASAYGKCFVIRMEDTPEHVS